MYNIIARTLKDKGGRDKQNKWTQWFDHLSTLLTYIPALQRAMIVLPTPFKIIRPDWAKISTAKQIRLLIKIKIFLSFLAAGPFQL